MATLEGSSLGESQLSRSTEYEQQQSGPEALREWPLFDAPAITSIRVTDYKQKHGVFYFLVSPILEGYQWTVERSYEDLATLYKTLVQFCGLERGLMPHKKVFSLFGVTKTENVVEFQRQFETLLMSILQKYPYPPGDLLKFLDYPYCDVLSVTQGLVEFFYTEGDLVLKTDKAVQMSPLQLHCVNRRLKLPIASSGGSGQMKDDFGHLLDFLQRLKKIKISRPAEENYKLSRREQLTFDMSLLKSLQVVLIECVDVYLIEGRQILPLQAEALEVRRSVSALQDILVVYPPDMVDLPASPDFNRALQWNSLKHANFRLNNLKKIDSSLCLLPKLEVLDLSYNCIEEVDNLMDLPHLNVVDLSHNKICSLPSLHTKMGNVVKISLSNNEITSLDGIDKVLSLVYVDLSHNEISEVSEVQHLSYLPCLEQLFLRGNPIAQALSYRSMVFAHLPHTSEQIALDGKIISGDEFIVISSMNSPRSNRVLSRIADIQPDVNETETREAQGELEAALNKTKQLEELRKEGGDRWLAIFNAERAKEASKEDEPIARGVREKKRTSKKHTHQRRHHKRHRSHRSQERESSLPPGWEEEEEEGGEVLSSILQGHIDAKRQEKIETTANFEVTVLEYTGSFQSLSCNDVDQLLVNTRLEECSVSIDSSLKRVLEVVVSAGKTRSARDLALLHDVKIHEGQRLAVCLQFSSFSATPLWVIYCTRNQVSLAHLYVALQHALQNSRTPTPEASFDASAITRASSSTPWSSKPGTEVQEHMDLPQTGSTQQEEPSPLQNQTATPVCGNTPSVSPSVTPARSHSPVVATQNASQTPPRGSSMSSSPVRSRSPVPGGLRTPPRPAFQTHSSPATPYGHGSRSPARHSSPVRSKTPDLTSAVPSSSHRSIPLSLTAALSVEANRDSQPTPADPTSQPGKPFPKPEPSSSKEPNPPAASAIAVEQPPRMNPAPPTETTKTASRKVVQKPGLDSQLLLDYFQTSVAKEGGEVLINVTWGGCSLSSSPTCELEAGLFLSSEGVYLVEVQDPEKHPKRQLSWSRGKLPLVPILKSSLITLSKITVGIFDQSVLVEFIEKGLVKSFVFFPWTYEHMLGLTENLKAVLDASDTGHQVTTAQESILDPPEPGKVLFLNPDSSDLQKLKESLVRARILIQVSNFIAACKAQDMNFSEEVRRLSDDASSKFEVVQYVFVSEVSTDVLPITNGRPHLRPRAIILTNDTVFLCKEENVSWPRPETTAVKPPLPRCVVLDSHPIAEVTEVTICDRAQPITSYSDPVYEFSISFEAVVGPSPSPSKSFMEWRLCVHDRQYVDQFISCLTQLYGDIVQSQLSVVHTADPIPVVAIQRSRRGSDALTRSGKGAFYQSEVLLRFIALPHYQRLKYFWKYVAQAQFMKADECLLSMFIARCAVDKGEYTEVEVCVMASNYAIYLVSDLDNIRRWLDRGGPFSFSRMSLLNKQDSSQPRCFYRLWLNEVSELKVGLFYLSVDITESKSDTSFVILPQNTSGTLSFLSALSSSLNLVNSAEQEELSELLSDYIDLGCDSLHGGVQNTRRSVRRTIEFSQPPDLDIELLKQSLLKISPSITKSFSEAECVATLQILCWQVMLLVEEIRIRDSMTVQSHPHLVLLTNYGLYVCANKRGEQNAPSVFTHDQLEVKKWCHIDLIDHIEVEQLSSSHTLAMTVYLRSQRAASLDSFRLVSQSSELLRYFLHFLALLWHERTSKQLPIHWN